jgi:hypothetical protein
MKSFSIILSFVGTIISGLFLVFWVIMFNGFAYTNNYNLSYFDIFSPIFLTLLPVLFTYFGIKTLKGNTLLKYAIPFMFIVLVLFILFSLGLFN